eukprot:1169563-Amphidinium_carterae.1
METSPPQCHVDSGQLMQEQGDGAEFRPQLCIAATGQKTPLKLTAFNRGKAKRKTPGASTVHRRSITTQTSSCSSFDRTCTIACSGKGISSKAAYHISSQMLQQPLPAIWIAIYPTISFPLRLLGSIERKISWLGQIRGLKLQFKTPVLHSFLQSAQQSLACKPPACDMGPSTFRTVPVPAAGRLGLCN